MNIKLNFTNSTKYFGVCIICKQQKIDNQKRNVCVECEYDLPSSKNSLIPQRQELDEHLFPIGGPYRWSLSELFNTRPFEVDTFI